VCLTTTALGISQCWGQSYRTFSTFCLFLIVRVVFNRSHYRDVVIKQCYIISDEYLNRGYSLYLMCLYQLTTRQSPMAMAFTCIIAYK